MKKKKYRLRPLDTKGFSLVEVLVAFMILLMASQLLLLGIAFARKVNTRTNQLETMRREIGMNLYEKSSAVSGTVQMEIGDGAVVLECPGWLYTGESEDEKEMMTVIWADEPDWNEVTGE